MRVMITGHLGFVGAETVKVFEANNVEVCGYDIMEGNDIRDGHNLDNFVSEKKPNIILHLAAIARFLEADRLPKLAFETNVDGTRNVVEVASKHNVPLVYSSTGSVLMPLDNYKPPFAEDIPARGNSVYGCTKAVAEYIVMQHTPHIILRYAHLYGKEKREHGLVWLFVNRIERGLQPVIYGGQQTADFCYIKDAAQANYKACIASWECWNHTYHIGSGKALTANEAGDAICKWLHYDGGVKVEGLRPFDPTSFCFDITKANRMLGYAPQYTFEAGLQDML